MIRNDCCDAWSVTTAHATEAQREMDDRRSRAMKGASCRRSCAFPGNPTCESGHCTFTR